MQGILHRIRLKRMRKDNKQNNFQKLLLSFKILQNISGYKIIERSIQKNSSDRTETSSRKDYCL